MSSATAYLAGTDALAEAIGAAPQVVLPSVSEYPIAHAQEMFDDLAPAIPEIEEIIGFHQGPMLWPKGNYVWPGVELEEALAQLPAGDYGVGAAVPQQVKLWEGTTQDLYSSLDLDRRFDEGWDDALMRRTGAMRGGR